MSEFTEMVVRLVGGIDSEPMPEDVLHSAKRVVIDTIACACAGLREPEVGELIDALSGASVHRTSNILGSSTKLDPMWAAIVHATAGVWHEFDCGSRFLGGDPATHVIPAAMATAQRAQATGEQFIKAVVAGFEAAARIGRSTELRAGMDPHGTWPNIGAAVAAGLLAGAPASALREAINMAASLTMATSMASAFEGATMRNLYAGYGAGVGVMCSDLAAAQFTGGSRAVESVFGELTGVRFSAELEGAGGGEQWEITRSYIKRHACARAIHPALDAFAQLVDTHAIGPDDLESVTVATFAEAVELGNPHAANELAARFSMPFALAVYAVIGRAEIGAFKTVDQATARDLAGRMKVLEDPARSARVPDEQGAAVTIVLKSGASVSGEVQLARGEADNDPLSDAEVSDKFLGLTSGTLSQGQAQTMLDRLWRLEAEPSVSAVFFP